MLIDEGNHHFGRRSSSAWAKKAAALRRISLARFNSLTSRSSSLRRSRSELDSPGRFPWSRSACRTHLRKVSPVQPILVAIETIADHCVLCSPWCSNTIRTARSRNSGEYFVVVFMTPSSQELESPGIPGRFNRGSRFGIDALMSDTDRPSETFADWTSERRVFYLCQK